MTNIHFPENTVESLEVVEVQEQPTVVQRVTDHPMSDMATVFDGTFTELFPMLAMQGLNPVGPAFSLHQRMPTDTATFEVGIPVDRALTESMTTASGVVLEPSVLPAGKIARVSYVGPYDGLGPAWGAFMESVVAAGEEPQFPFWEIYVTEPSPELDPATLRSDLVTLLRG